MLLRIIALAATLLLPVLAQADWNGDWTEKKKISINSSDATELVSNLPVLVRLHSGNFDFTSANLDGSDLRFIAADDKTELKYFVEKYDGANELAVIWVQVPQITGLNKEAHFWMYFGNEGATSTTGNAQTVLDSNTSAHFAFSEKTLLKDSSKSGIIASGVITAQKAGLIGESAVFSGQPMIVANSPAVSPSASYTWSAWLKPASLPQTAALLHVGDDLTLNLEGDTLSLSVADVAIKGGTLKATAWQHVAFTLGAGKVVLYLNGVEVANGAANPVPTTKELVVGEAFTGEMDELDIAATTRSPIWVKLAASSQGVDSKLLTLSASEGEESADEEGEANYIGILVNSLTLDAKVVIAILAVMFAVSVWVMWVKFSLVTRTDKDNKKFLVRFQKADQQQLLELDKGADYKHSNLFMLYLAGLREIKKRERDGQLSLSGSSMDAIKAAIDADLVRETQRQNAGIVLLTIAISGGPFLGLLGTVVGVMITFAAIAAAGDVNVNAIAPGIAAALLATVAGLGVAIPALFAYNYLASRIKNITIAMQIFVDEFVTRTAEAYGKE